MLSYVGVLEQSGAGLKQLLKSGEEVIGYIYPHTPLELLLAHGLIPSLLRAFPGVPGGFEESLQTFACSYIRNLYSQRTNDQMPSLAGLIFPSNTCDSLQNLSDVWRFRFPDDIVFRLTYPVTRHENDGSTVAFFTKELQLLSDAIEKTLDHPFSIENYKRAVQLVRQFREDAQYLYSARVVAPNIISYTELCRLVRTFMTAPLPAVGSELHNVASSVRNKMKEKALSPVVESIIKGLRTGDFSFIRNFKSTPSPRIIVTGGMVEPQAIANVITGIPRISDSIIVLDTLSFGFKTAFTPSLDMNDEPFEAMAKSILSSPGEPTQEGLSYRMKYLEGLIRALKIEGLMICEQSFCDPDQFEAPSIERTASNQGVRTIRIPIDPELSDRSRMEVRIQSFLESIGKS
jgi:benzoyl-CoA reductase/2-hydroxyglutaryl-CoA dehydratase subunit BcrC/BadD/HgdB